MKVCVIINPVAGPAFLRPDLKRALALLPSFGWDVTVRQTAAGGEATDFSRTAVAEGCDMVVACGGDGTINEVLQALPGSNVTLGIIPTGTANVFAREMHIPLNPVEAAMALASGRTRNLDVGMAGERYFLLWAGVGFDAEVLLNIKPKDKRRYGIPAFAVATALTALKFDGTRAEITVNGVKLQRRVLLIIMSNIKQYALFELSSSAEPDDGLLDICLFEGRGLRTKLRHFLAFLSRQHYRSPQVEVYRASSISLRLEHPLPVQIDGDVIGETPMSFRIVPRSLRVKLPR